MASEIPTDVAAPTDPVAALFVDVPELMQIVEVAELLRMSREGVRKWTTRGTVASLKFPKSKGMVRLFRDDVHTLLTRSYRGGEAAPPASPVVTVAQLLEPFPDRMTVREVAAVLRMTPDGVREWTKQGVIPALDLPGKVVILRSDLHAVLDAAYTQPWADRSER